MFSRVSRVFRQASVTGLSGRLVQGPQLKKSLQVPFKTFQGPLRSFAAFPLPNGRFDPPAYLTDLKPENLQAWSDLVSSWHDDIQAGQEGPNEVSYVPTNGQFFNPLKTKIEGQPAAATITWIAFPNKVKTRYPGFNRFSVADSSRNLQDEYCEWSVTRVDPNDDSSKIKSVVFTSEGPEYWDFLFQKQPDTVLKLYQQYISPKVTMADLKARDGSYNPHNKWNSDSKHGAMHLISPPNSLGAEIQLAADASVIRQKPDGSFRTDEQDLINCAQYGVATRNSDPHIGAEVNKLAQQGYLLTISNPVGLYMQGLNTAAWSTPDGSDAQKYWKILRGGPNRIERAVFEVPEGAGFVVGDIQTADGNSISYGSQIADYITVSLTGVAVNRKDSNKKPTKACGRTHPKTAALRAGATRSIFPRSF